MGDGDVGDFLAVLDMRFLLILFLFLPGCDLSELERLQKIADTKDRFFRGCLPRKGDKVIAEWEKGDLICRRITPTGRYGKTFPHAEVRISEVEL